MASSPAESQVGAQTMRSPFSLLRMDSTDCIMLESRALSSVSLLNDETLPFHTLSCHLTWYRHDWCSSTLTSKMRVNVQPRSGRNIVPPTEMGAEEVLMCENFVVQCNRRWMKIKGRGWSMGTTALGPRSYEMAPSLG